MHDGSIATLDAALDHYREGGRTIPEGPHAGVGWLSPLNDMFIVGFGLSPDSRAAVLATLDNLINKQFVRDARFSDPFAPSAV